MRPFRGPAARAVGSFVPKLTRKAFEKYGFSAATLLTDWATIVGQDLASYTSPDKLKWPRGAEAYREVAEGAEGRPGATLILRVDGPRALEVEHRRRQLLERINAYFGYRAVADLRIIQAPIASPAAAKVPAVPAPVPAQLAAGQAAALQAITDERLRDALAKLGASVTARRPR
jgi:hypothetical protein